MNTLIRQSGQLLEKWDEVRYAAGATFDERAAELTLERVDHVYDPDV